MSNNDALSRPGQLFLTPLLPLLSLALLCRCSDPPSTPDAGQDITVDVAWVDAIKDAPAQEAASSKDTSPDQAPVNDGAGQDLVGDAAAFPLCSSKGGLCTKQRWIVCPAGFEPIHPSPHQDCGTGWCCVKAPTSTCSAKAGVNCVFGSACTGCWSSATDTTLACESGRVCCEDICD
jgi:hypothetical protein